MRKFQASTLSATLLCLLFHSGCCPPWSDCDPTCQVTPPNLNFGSILIGTHRDFNFEIKNTGGGTLEGTVSASGCPDYSIVSGGGNFSLDADQTREVKVRFAPVSTGVKVCTVNIGTGSCIGVRCAGEADPGPECLVTPAVLDFDTVRVGAYSDLSFEIENIGGVMLDGDVNSSGCGGYSIISGGGAFDLEPGETQMVTVRYAPLAAGAETCYVDIGSDSCAVPMCVGVGTPGAACLVTADTLDFGSVQIGTFQELGFEIENVAEGTLMGNVSESCNYFSVRSGGGDYSLDAGQRHSVTVRFNPTTTAEVTCSIDLGTGLCPGVFCKGQGNTGPQCQVTPSNLSFGTIDLGSYKDMTFEVRNVGSGTLNGNVSESSLDYAIISGGGAYALGPVEAMTVTVRFTPTAIGTIPGTIDTGTGLCSNVSCTGAGVLGPVCRLTPETLDFGTIYRGEIAELTFEIENVGGGILTCNITENHYAFSLVYGGGIIDLPSGASHEVKVRFAPTGIGFYTCYVQTGVAGCPWVRCTGTSIWDGAKTGGD